MLPLLLLVATALADPSGAGPPAPAAVDQPVDDSVLDEPADAPPPAPPSLDKLIDDALSLRWVDPQDARWAPRRGQRLEVSGLVGGEAAFGSLSTDRLPSVGGLTVDAQARYYPVDRLAVIVGARTYLGIEKPAPGTTASSVLTLITGLRYDLVRENRFSLMWDLYSGPSVYLFNDIPDVSFTALAVGGEMGSGVSMRYSVGGFTAEVRSVVGGRAGASSTPFQRAGDAGPFSAVYAGVQLGGTWSYE